MAESRSFTGKVPLRGMTYRTGIESRRDRDIRRDIDEAFLSVEAEIQMISTGMPRCPSG